MSKRYWAGAAVLGVVGSLACGRLGSRSDEVAPDKSGASAKDTTIRSGRKGAAPSADTSKAGSPAPRPGGAPEGAVPDIPAARSKPPTVDEWIAAPEVSTQDAGARPNDCYLKIVREWLKVHCNGSVTGTMDMDGFGEENVDYYQQVTPGKPADFVVRLRKGVSMKLTIQREGQDAVLLVSWPSSEPRPLRVELGIGKP
jgi:hypothetical protein